LDEFIYAIKSGELTSLTNTPKEWDEFAQITPDGKYIVWDTSLGTDQKRNSKGNIIPKQVKLEYWIMNPDGSSKERLTHFNVPGYPEYRPNGVSCAVFSFNPDGSKFVAKIRALPARYDENEQIIIIELEK
jgi:Tol biopolymer transport system component